MTTSKNSRRTLVEAQQASLPRAVSVSASVERAVLVAVEFNGERRKLAAAQARKAAAVVASSQDEEIGSARSSSSQATDLDFEASLAEFEELARSAGAEIVATLVQKRARPDHATSAHTAPSACGRRNSISIRGSVTTGKRFEGNLVYLTVRGPSSLLNRYREIQGGNRAEGSGVQKIALRSVSLRSVFGS